MTQWPMHTWLCSCTFSLKMPKNQFAAECLSTWPFYSLNSVELLRSSILCPGANIFLQPRSCAKASPQLSISCFEFDSGQAKSAVDFFREAEWQRDRGLPSSAAVTVCSDGILVI